MKCKSCSITTNSNQKTFCSECFSFLKYSKFFERLGVQNDNIRVAVKDAKLKLNKLYHVDKKSLGQICLAYKIHKNSLYSFFIKAGLLLRSRIDGIRLAKGSISKENPHAKSWNDLRAQRMLEKQTGRKIEIRNKVVKVMDKKHVPFFFDERNKIVYDRISKKWFQKRKDFFEKLGAFYAETFEMRFKFVLV